MSGIRYLHTKGGNPAPAWVVTDTAEGELLTGWGNPVALRRHGGAVVLDSRFWDYSVSTHRFRGQFLGENTAATRKRLASGEYALATLEVTR